MSDDFDFEEGDTVLVRVRDHDDGMVAKFVSECTNIEGENRMTGTRARFEFPAGTMNSITLATYEAEFEVVESAAEVDF